MKFFILCTVLAVSQAAVLIAPLHGVGASTQYRSQDGFGNYAFGYDEGHGLGSTFRRETGDAAGNKVGSYGLRDADGRLRIVSYTAGADGYKVNIQTNEPGVDESKEPANTVINKAEPIVPLVTYAHPIAAHHPVGLGHHAVVTNFGPVPYSYSF